MSYLNTKSAVDCILEIGSVDEYGIAYDLAIDLSKLIVGMWKDHLLELCQIQQISSIWQLDKIVRDDK